MVMSVIWCGILTVSLLFSLFLGKGNELAAAIPAGAQNAVTLARGDPMDQHPAPSHIKEAFSVHGKRQDPCRTSKCKHMCQHFGIGQCRYSNGYSGSPKNDGSKASRLRYRRNVSHNRAEHGFYTADPGKCGSCPLSSGLFHTL